MAQKSSVYWSERQEQLLNQLEKDDRKLMQKLDRIYRKETNKLSKEIASFMATYGEDNVVQYNKLMVELDDDARTMLIEQMDEFMRKFPEYRHLSDVRKNIYKLNRLQGLQQSVYMQQMEIGAIEQEELTKHLEEVYKTGNKSVLDFLGHGTTMSSYNKDLFTQTVNAKWVNNENFSDRIWSNREKLANYINEDLRTEFAKGSNTQTIMKHMKERFPDAERANMARLIRTEGTYLFNEAQAQTWEDSGVEEYIYSAVLDRKTSDICQNLDGMTFKWADREPGVNFPPMHPNCRSTYTLPDLDEDWLMNQMRKENPSRFENSAEGESAPAPELLKTDSNVVQGRNLVGDWHPKSQDKQFFIQEVVHEQGFDGLPRVIPREEFEQMARQNNFYAERTYTATSMEQLKEYQDQLYSGDWYIDCSTGGAQYGQGMYCAASYNVDDLTTIQGIKSEMEHYIDMGFRDGRITSEVEAITLDPSARILELPHGERPWEYIGRLYEKEYYKKFATTDEAPFVDRYLKAMDQYDKLDWSEPRALIEAVKKEMDDAGEPIDRLIEEYFQLSRKDPYDPGVLAVQMGYDAINAVGHGASGSYTVILNRTKVIFSKEGGGLFGE